MASCGMPTGPTAFPFFICLMALLISSLLGLLSSTSKGLSAGSTSGISLGGGLFSSSLKWSAHLCRRSSSLVGEQFSTLGTDNSFPDIISTCQCSRDGIEVFHITLAWSFLRLFCETVYEVPSVLSYASFNLLVGFGVFGPTVSLKCLRNSLQRIGNLFKSLKVCSLPRSRFLGCHATLPPKEGGALRDSPKNGCEGD